MRIGCETHISPAGFSATVTTRWADRCAWRAGPKPRDGGFPYVVARLYSVALGADLNPQDSFTIMHLCLFETPDKEKLSPFCSLFSKEDLESYEYAGDLEKFYTPGTDHTLPVSRHQPFVRQMCRFSRSCSRHRIHQRTHRPPTNSLTHHGLQTVGTLLSSPITSLSDRAMHVDFCTTTRPPVSSLPWARPTEPMTPSIQRRPSRIGHRTNHPHDGILFSSLTIPRRYRISTYRVVELGDHGWSRRRPRG